LMGLANNVGSASLYFMYNFLCFPHTIIGATVSQDNTA